VESGDSIHDIIKFVRSTVPIYMIGTGWVASDLFLTGNPAGPFGDVSVTSFQSYRLRLRSKTASQSAFGSIIAKRSADWAGQLEESTICSTAR
jgi:hypothetical protein